MFMYVSFITNKTKKFNNTLKIPITNTIHWIIIEQFFTKEIDSEVAQQKRLDLSQNTHNRYTCSKNVVHLVEKEQIRKGEGDSSNNCLNRDAISTQ